MGLLAIGFFTFFFSDEKSILGQTVTSFLGLSPLALTVYFGSLQNCMSKAGKYSLFDATKEIAFLQEDKQTRLKGKAAIDGIGSSLGKSGSSLVSQVVIVSLGNIMLAAPFFAALVALIFPAWISAALFIGKRFRSADREQSFREHSTDASKQSALVSEANGS